MKEIEELLKALQTAEAEYRRAQRQRDDVKIDLTLAVMAIGDPRLLNPNMAAVHAMIRREK